MLIVVALLASSAGYYGISAMADNAEITESAALSQAVSLYEKMSGDEVAIPSDVSADGLDGDMLKSVVLGYINLDDASTAADEGITKQDMANVLYKTVISYDGSFEISSEEADSILNGCYDNAYIKDENRIAYAFMIKHGIITDKTGSEPDKKITQESCEILTELIYDLFEKKASVDTGKCTVTVGANINTVIDAIGEPNRIDCSEYGFDWYVYNADLNNFVMIGVEADRICSFYTNNPNFSVGEIKSGDGYAKTLIHDSDKNLSFYTDKDGKIDAVLYNPRMKNKENSEESAEAKSKEFIDMMNVYRKKNGKSIYVRNAELDGESKAILEEFKNNASVDEKASVYRSYSVFNMYNEYLNDDNRFLDYGGKYSLSVGVSSYIDDKYRLVTSLICDENSVAVPEKAQTVSLNREIPKVSAPEKYTAPELEAPTEEIVYNDGDDVTVKLKEQASDRYHVEMFDVENDDYVINAYMVTDATEITLPAELFKNGGDYRLKVSAITPDGFALSSDDTFISYGSAYESGVKILTPYNGAYTDDDYLAINWESEEYHDFCVDLYDYEGNLVASKTVENQYDALIQGIDPGEYYVYVTALRRGTAVEKSQASVYCKVNMPEPVIDEFILDRNEKYYFVYEDKDLGVLYLYDEELVDVNENGTTVKKKKIIRKQVKATKAYKALAAKQIRREYTTGEPVLTPTTVTASSELGQKIVNEAAKYLGTPYVWGGTTPDGFDCSGLVQYVFNSLGIDISRVSQTQFNEGVPVSKGDLQPGDLVFFESNGDVHHVGIYAGNGMMIHAPRTGDVVRFQSMETPYYQSEYAGARRIY